MNDQLDRPSILIGLVGFRCCGKSTLRVLLGELGYPVFNTNSVTTGDPDANRISLDEVIERYGAAHSYLHYIAEAMREFVAMQDSVVFVDSLKVGSDLDVLKELFPRTPVELWYVHASFQTRKNRYLERDIRPGLRDSSLEEHDAALERHGVLSLIKQATEVVNTELDLQMVRMEVEGSVRRTLKRYGICGKNSQ